MFDLSSPASGPFPSDRFTLPDPRQNTGLRVNMPKPNCVARPSDCADIDVINTLDGFNIQPRLGIPPVANTVPGTLEIQTVIENSEWVTQAGVDPDALGRPEPHVVNSLYGRGLPSTARGA